MITITIIMLFLTPVQGNVVHESAIVDEILIIAEDELDNQLANQIVTQGIISNNNYTVINLGSNDDLNQVLIETQLENYHSLIIIASNLTVHSFSDQVIGVLSNRTVEGMSISLISSKIWHVNPLLKELFGFVTPDKNGEYSQHGSRINIDIVNDSILKNPFSFVKGQQISVSARAGIIEDVDPGVLMIAESNNIGGESNHNSGVYLKILSSGIPGKLLTIPFSLHSLSNNTEMVEFIVSAVTDSIIWSSQLASNNSQNGDGDNSTEVDPFITLFKEINIQNAVAIGSVVVVGSIGIVLAGAAVKQVKSSSKTSEDDTDEEWDTEVSWILYILAPLIAIFSQIIYSPKIRKITQKKVADNPIRQKIVELLEIKDFDHFNSIKKQLKTGVSVLKWHLQVLEDFGLARSLSYGQFVVYYLTGNRPSEEDVKIYYTLRSNRALAIANEFVTIKSWNVSKLSAKLSMNQDTAKYHCYKLVSADILTVNEESGEFFLIPEKSESLKRLVKKIGHVSKPNGS
ncbi:MAG: hypothetical protein ACXAEU_17460 [Candidatus Hodarchaeales archaeon]